MLMGNKVSGRYKKKSCGAVKLNDRRQSKEITARQSMEMERMVNYSEMEDVGLSKWI